MGRFLVYLSIVMVYAVLSLGKPANDWSKPCFHGECAYDMPEHTGHSGALKIFGSPRAITDITPAAGWVILDCDPHAFDQEVRLVCASDDADASGCNHVFDHGGPEDKLVRLPESCGGGPFMRIASAHISEDQSIPHHAAGKISRRDGVSPMVHVIKIDSNLAAINAAKTGTVDFVFAGGNVPDIDGSIVLDGLDARGLFGWISNAFNAVKNAVVSAAHAVVNTLSQWTGFKINPEHVINIKHNTTGDIVVFEAHTSDLPHCGNGIEASLKVEAGGSINADVKIGLVVNGSVIPPSIGSWAVYAIIDADVDAHIHAHAYIHGHLDTQRKQLLSFPIPLIEIPPILSLHPELRLDARAELDLAIEMDIDAHLKYNVNKLEFWYPKEVNNASTKAVDRAKGITSHSAPLSITAAAGLAAEASIRGHLIPQLHLTLSLLSGLAAKASAYVEVDVWAQADVTAHASAAVSRRGRDIDVETVPTHEFTPPYLNTRNNNLDDKVEVQFIGCLDLFAGVAIEGGAQASFLADSVQAKVVPWKIWGLEKPISIYHNCWGTTGATKPPKTLSPHNQQLTCGAGNLIPVSKNEHTKEESLEHLPS